MLYLVCRADQVPERFNVNYPIEFKPSVEFYPRLVWGNDPEDAVSRAFHPEKYKPRGERSLVVIELGEIFQLTASPIPPPPPPPNYTISLKKRARELLRPY